MPVQSSTLARRQFIRASLVVASGFTALKQFAEGANAPARTLPLVKNPAGVIDLPEGLTYEIISQTGDQMNDGLIVPGYPDGMGAFAGKNGEVRLVCNHELESKGEGEKAEMFRELGPFGRKNDLYSAIDRDKIFDRGESGFYPSLGGTTTLSYDPTRRTRKAQHLSLGGTERNCAGGVTPWGTWLTCEESNEVPDGEFLERHGYCFEVDPASDGLQAAIPYRAMGRFRREAVAVDPATGIVYMTEDMGDGLFYRFIPKKPGHLGAGGKVQALAFIDQSAADTRNWKKKNRIPVGDSIAVKWVDLEQVDSPEDDLRLRGSEEQGAAVFARSEGIWYSTKDRSIYFAATSGGASKLGQIFRYQPIELEGDQKAEAETPPTLSLFIEPNDINVLKSADNLTIAPWGDVIFCEDFPSDSRVRGIRPNGETYDIALNQKSDSEFAGACFAPGLDDLLFVNIQKPGITLAIHGMKSLAT